MERPRPEVMKKAGPVANHPQCRLLSTLEHQTYVNCGAKLSKIGSAKSVEENYYVAYDLMSDR
jgi:hypothetical protein